MERDLEIRLKLSHDQAEQAAREWHEAEQARIKATATAAAAGSKAQTEADREGKAAQRTEADRHAERLRAYTKRSLTEVESAELAKLMAIRRTHSEATATAAESFKTQGEAARDLHKGWRSSQAVVFGAAAVGLRELAQLANAYGESVKTAMAKQQEMAKGFISTRDSLGELASLMGEKPDDAFTRRMAEFNKATGFRPDEGRQFLTELYNSGAQFEGKTIGKPEFAEYSRQAGQLALARNIRPEVVGDVAGNLLGFTNYQQRYGAQASEQALGHLNASLAILGRGKGDNAVLARQYSMLASAALNEESMRGTFQTPEEVASVVSIAAEKHDAQAAELAQMAIRGLRGFGKRQGTMLKQAGVTPQDAFITSLQKLAPVVEAQARAQGVKTEDVLRKNFEDEATINALNVFLNKGVSGGGFLDRAQFGATVAGPAPALGLTRDYLTSQRGMARVADADIEVARLERGQETAGLEIVRRQALAGLVRRKEIDTSATGVSDYMYGKVGFLGLGTAEQRRIDTEARNLLNARTPAPAFQAARAAGTGGFRVGAEDLQGSLLRQMEAVEKFGGNPFADMGEAARATALEGLTLPERAKMQRGIYGVLPGTAAGPEVAKAAASIRRPPLPGPSPSPWGGAMAAAFEGMSEASERRRTVGKPLEPLAAQQAEFQASLKRMGPAALDFAAKGLESKNWRKLSDQDRERIASFQRNAELIPGLSEASPERSARMEALGQINAELGGTGGDLGGASADPFDAAGDKQLSASEKMDAAADKIANAVDKLVGESGARSGSGSGGTVGVRPPTPSLPTGRPVKGAR